MLAFGTWVVGNSILFGILVNQFKGESFFGKSGSEKDLW